MTTTQAGLGAGQSRLSIARLPRRRRAEAEAASWKGPLRHYDIVKEATIAFVVVAVLTVALALVFSSPDKPPVTIEEWAKAQPVGFSEIALSELEGTSNSATYGPPYNHGTGSVQYLGPISIQQFFGIRYPLDPARSFVLDPLSSLPPTPALESALRRYERATPAARLAWEHAYGRALARATFVDGHLSVVPTSAEGPVPELLSSLLTMARSGALDAQLVEHKNAFYTTNYTNPIMFIGDSWKAQRGKSYWGEIVTAEHLKGGDWGVMNETGSWPGQPWLWLYTMWYQIPPMSTSGNGDVEVMAIMTVLSLALLVVPFIPGLRDIPRKIPLHRVIWRQYYRRVAAENAPQLGSEPPGGAPPA